MSLLRTWTAQSHNSQRSTRSYSSTQATQSPPDLLRQLSSTRPPASTSRPGLRHTISTNDLLGGNLNHLSEEQSNQFRQFKSALLETGLYAAASLGQPASHADETLLRFLRARKFDVEGAVGQFSETEQWSRDNKIPELYETIDVELFERARQMYPQWTGRRDKRGIPVYVYNVKQIDSKNINALTKEAADLKAKMPHHASLPTPPKMLPLFALYEHLLHFVLPLCSSIEPRPNPEMPVTNSNNIVDITGVGMKQFWNLKSHMQESSVLANAHYPETLDRIFIIGAPSFFPTVWGWIKRWFDPVTVNKIYVIPHNEVKTRLAELIDPNDFPKKYGGNLDWECGMPPNMDDAVRQAVERNGTPGWIEGPCLWEHNQRVPVGTQHGTPRRPAELTVTRTSSPPASAQTSPNPTSETTSPNLPPSPRAVQSSKSPPLSPPPPPPPPPSQPQPQQPTAPSPPTTADAPSIVVTNGEILREKSHQKPPMERFVTALEDLKV